MTAHHFDPEQFVSPSDDSDHDALVSAEDFLEYYGIEYDPAIVQVNRLHILQRFHQLLAAQDQLSAAPDEPAARHALQSELLRTAYQEFINTDARSAKVLRVFQRSEPTAVTVSVNALMNSLSDR